MNKDGIAKQLIKDLLIAVMIEQPADSETCVADVYILISLGPMAISRLWSIHG